MIVRNIDIREIFATTAVKTIELELETDTSFVRSSVPVGTSRGKYEAHYIPTDAAVRKLAILRSNFRAKRFDTQKELDDFLHSMDRTDGFKEIGGNLALALSTAFLKAFAKEADMNLFNYVASLMPGKRNMEMPKPLCNIVGGWNRKGMQEFLLFPVHQDSFMSSVEKMAEAYREVAGKIKQADPEFDHGKNIESAWVTDLPTEKVLDILKGVADKNMLKIGLDVAASQLWDGKNYVCGDERLSRPEFSAFIYDLVEKYPISYVEDPLHEDDFLGFGIISQRLGYKGKFVCGDDLYATNIKRLKEGIVNRSTNAVIVKPNQIGTITDTINFVSEAQAHKWKIVVSHRSGETEDTMLCHLAVGVGADFVKFGIAGDRTPKINEMIRIEEKLKR